MNPVAGEVATPDWRPPDFEPSSFEIPGKAEAEELLAQSEEFNADPEPELVETEAAQLERKARLAMAEDEARQFTYRISMREIIGLTTFLALVFSFLLNFGDFAAGIVMLILFVNLIGIVVGLLVTHLGGLPNDGGLRDDSGSSK